MKRLVVISGPIASGKTSLALHVATAQRRHLADGAWLCDLSSLVPHDDIALAVASTLDLQAGSGPGVHELLLNHLRDRRVLMVLDNCENVLETAAATSATTGWTELYITPPHRFGAVGAMITNFHLPRSSLLLLVTAFVQAGMAGATPLQARDRLLTGYREALAGGYRFFSFGDAMLIR